MLIFSEKQAHFALLSVIALGINHVYTESIDENNLKTNILILSNVYRTQTHAYYEIIS